MKKPTPVESLESEVVEPPKEEDTPKATTKKGRKARIAKILKKRNYEGMELCCCDECCRLDPGRKKFFEEEWKNMRNHLKKKSLPE